jgi:hypothetical protein
MILYTNNVNIVAFIGIQMSDKILRDKIVLVSIYYL